MSETKETKSGHAMRIAADIWEQLVSEATEERKRTGKLVTERKLAERILRKALKMPVPS